MCSCHFDPPSMEPVANRNSNNSNHNHATLSHTNTQSSLLSPQPSLRSCRSPAQPNARKMRRRAGQPCSPLLVMENQRCLNPLGITPRVPQRGGLPISDSSQDTMYAASHPPPRQEGFQLSHTFDSNQPWSSSMGSGSWDPHEVVVASFEPLQLPESFLERLQNASSDGVRRLVE